MLVIEQANYTLKLTQTEVDIIALCLSQLSATAANRYCSELTGQFKRISSHHLEVANADDVEAIEIQRKADK